MSKQLFTIGYEGLDPERLVGVLRSAGVAVLAVTGVASSPQVALCSSISMAPLCSMIRSTAGTRASSSSDAVDSTRVEVIGEEPDEDATVADKIGSFFHKVFGAESSQHAGRYPEAARRGSTIVTVSLEDEARVPAVERIMEHNGAIE
ncbi:hypothetical protein OMR07_22705, partial [Methylobacterium organophilum]|nr:hypothetical protein [Methylobacterium organophilum]